MMILIIGKYYELDYRKGKKLERRVFMYQGQRDTGGTAHVFVNDKGLYCVEPGVLEKINPKETSK